MVNIKITQHHYHLLFQKDKIKSLTSRLKNQLPSTVSATSVSCLSSSSKVTQKQHLLHTASSLLESKNKESIKKIEQNRRAHIDKLVVELDELKLAHSDVKMKSDGYQARNK